MDWRLWYQQQVFFSKVRENRILEWMKPRPMENLELWYVKREEHEGRSNSRTAVHASTYNVGNQRLLEGGAYRSIAKLLGCLLYTSDAADE